MSYKLLSVSTMYKGYLESFYRKYPGIHDSLYTDHLNRLLTDSFEFVGVYTKNFRCLGLEADCIIANDKVLQQKWAGENAIRNRDESSIIFDQIRLYKPEVLWIENLSIFSKERLKKIKDEIKSIKLVIGYHCAPVNSKINEVLGEIDFLFTCTPGLKELFKSFGKKAFLVYHGFDDDITKMLSASPEPFHSNFVFSGSLIPGGSFHNDRIRFIEKLIGNSIDLDLYVNLDSTLRIKMKQLLNVFYKAMGSAGLEKLSGRIKILEHGKSEIVSYSDELLRKVRLPVFGIDMYNLFRHSRIVFNYHIGAAGNSAGNMRMFEVTGAGSCLLTDNKSNIRELFEPDSDIIVYNNADECISKVKWLLDNENERKNIALNGQQKTLKYHTVRNRCETILEIISQEIKYSII